MGICAVLAACSSFRAAEPGQTFNPELGAIKAAADWKETVFIILDAGGETVIQIPELNDVPYSTGVGDKPPQGFGAKGFWVELKPGKYVLYAFAPGKKALRRSVEVVKDNETSIRVDLGDNKSDCRVAGPHTKTGREWRKE